MYAGNARDDLSDEVSLASLAVGVRAIVEGTLHMEEKGLVELTEYLVKYESELPEFALKSFTKILFKSTRFWLTKTCDCVELMNSFVGFG